MNNKIKLEDLIPIISEKLASGGTFEMNFNGTSMLPLLVEGRDSVVLKGFDGNIKKYDIPLYKRDDGNYVLHRVVKADNEIFTACGDNQWIVEKGVRNNQVIGIVCEIVRNGKRISVESFSYKLYCRIWEALRPIRKYIIKIKGKLRK